MSFSKALELLKDGLKVARRGWNNPCIWIQIQMPTGKNEVTKPFIMMYKYEEKFPCDLSCESILANDWEVVK